MSDQSRNSWIRQDNPRLVSARQKDIYEDILEDRRNNSDIVWSFRTREEPVYKYNKPRTPEDIRKHVINSDRVKYAVEQCNSWILKIFYVCGKCRYKTQKAAEPKNYRYDLLKRVCSESGLPIGEVWKQAWEVMDEMSHNLRMGAIRSFAVFMVKVLKSLFKRIYVNTEGIEKVREMLEEYPVLLMPSHRSYFDFLLMSYVFYSYDLPLPVIAAAMDFMGMKFFGWLLRNSGAFYIRRSFGDDPLYWAVFTEYVQTQLCNGDHPIEFYVEGTRSRTSKSYAPKFGMLSAALEPYFKAHIPDIMVIPISISYDKILEEALYAYEILGVPKPKESTSGLFKARNLLSEDFGNVHVHFGEPLSIRKFTDGKVDRSVHSLAPRYIASLTNDENKLIQSLGYRVVLLQLQHMVISPWSLMAAVLVQNKDGIQIKQLIKEVEWIKRQASNLGAYIDWPGNETADAVIRSTLALHKNIAEVDSEDIIHLLEIQHPTRGSQDELMQAAAQHLILTLYKNQLMHIFVRVAMVTLSINLCTEETLSMNELYRKYEFLENLLNRDFIFMPGHTKQDFLNAMLTLTHSCGVVVEDDVLQVKKSLNKYTTFFSQMFEPFLLGYWIACKSLLSMHNDAHGKPIAKPPKTIAKEAQILASRLLRDGLIRHLEVLSLDLINNGLHALYHIDAARKEKRDNQTYMYPNTVKLTGVCTEIEKYIDVPHVPDAIINVSSKTVTINAKL